MSHEEVPQEETPRTLCRDEHHPPHTHTLEDSKASSPRPPAPVSTRSPNGWQLELSPLLRVIQGTGESVMGFCSIPPSDRHPRCQSRSYMSNLPSLTETYLQDLRSLETRGLLPPMSPATVIMFETDSRVHTGSVTQQPKGTGRSQRIQSHRWAQKWTWLERNHRANYKS